MKNILKVITLLAFSAFLFNGCDEIDNSRFGNDPTTGWVEFQGSGSTTITFLTEQLALPLDINVPIYENGLNISYSLEAVQGNFADIVNTSGNVFIDPAVDFRSGEVILDFVNLDQLAVSGEVIVFDVVLTGVAETGVNVGVDSESLTRFRVSTPCPVEVTVGAGSYTASETLYNGAADAPQGYAIEVTVEDEANFIYSVDTVWGPDFIGTLCGGCVPGGDYPGPITFQVDPVTFEVTVLSGGEPSGVGNTFDIAYTITGTGVMDTCANIITFDLEQSLLTTGGIPGTVDVVIAGN